MSSAALKAQALVRQVVAPYVRPGDRISRQKQLSFQILRADELPSGWSKVERAWKGRAQAPTYQALREQAERLGRLKDNSEHIARLRATQELLYERYGDRHHPEIQALEWALAQLDR